MVVLVIKNLSDIAKSLIITGTANEVSQKIKFMKHDIGELGSLTYVHVPLVNHQVFDDSLKTFFKKCQNLILKIYLDPSLSKKF